MFKSAGQRAAFFAALKKKNAGIPQGANPLAVKKPSPLEAIAKPAPLQEMQKLTPLPTVNAIQELQPPKISKFGKLKKLMKLPKV